MKTTGKERPPLVKVRKKRIPKSVSEKKDKGTDSGIFVLEMGINPRVVYTRPAVGEEKKPVSRKKDPEAPDVYDSVTYFIYPYQTWQDGNKKKKGICSCPGFRIQSKCKHLAEAQKRAEPYKHLLQTTTIIDNPNFQE